MAELGLQGRKPPRRRKNLPRQGKRKAARDLVLRGFDAIAPDVLWWGDMTEIETGEGKLYLASVHDAFSRRVLGYAMVDNAAAESFHSVLKVEYIHRHRFATRAEARLKIATWIADFFNTRRRHSAAGGLAPVEFERTVAEARSRSQQEAQAA